MVFGVAKKYFELHFTRLFLCSKQHIMKTPFNKFLYIGFLLLGIYQAVFTKEYMQATSSLGIGLAFDPFNQEQKWNDRPTWQKVVLIAHLALVAAMFGYGIGLVDRL
jgi:hypothetical protein